VFNGHLRYRQSPFPEADVYLLYFSAAKLRLFFIRPTFFTQNYLVGGFFFLRSSIKYGCFLAYRLNVVVFSVPHCVTIESPPDILHYETLICKDIVGSTLHSLGGAVEIQPLRGGKIIRHI